MIFEVYICRIFIHLDTVLDAVPASQIIAHFFITLKITPRSYFPKKQIMVQSILSYFWRILFVMCNLEPILGLATCSLGWIFRYAKQFSKQLHNILYKYRETADAFNLYWRTRTSYCTVSLHRYISFDTRILFEEYSVICIFIHLNNIWAKLTYLSYMNIIYITEFCSKIWFTLKYNGRGLFRDADNDGFETILVLFINAEALLLSNSGRNVCWYFKDILLNIGCFTLKICWIDVRKLLSNKVI